MPLGDTEMFAQSFNVGDKVPGGIVRRGGIGAGLSTSTLVEQYHAVF